MSLSLPIREPFARWCSSPLFWILLTAALLRTAGLLWGLPAADGWDDDGVAPRNFLVGLIQSYSPGSHFTYPPLHMILLAVLTAPGWIIAITQAPTLHPQDIIREIVQTPYMTFFAIVARIVSVGFSLGTIYFVAKMTELVADRHAGLFAAAVLTLNAALTYYGQVTNLDGPSIFWAILSLFFWMRLMVEHDLKHIRWAALSAAAAVATKDQTYAVFVLGLPIGFALWFGLDRWPREHLPSLVRSVLIWCSIALLALLAIDGAFVNPHGFADRIAFLVGPASQDYAQYESSWAGRFALLTDIWANFPRYYPALAAILALGGLVLVCRRRGGQLASGVLPMLAAVSFTLTFNMAALRTETRFLLPQSVLLSIYIGIAVSWLMFATHPICRWGARAVCLAVACFGFVRCIGIDMAFLTDPRYDAERWMQAAMKPGDRVEIYGLNAYLPRFPDGVEVRRIGPKPLKARNPLPQVTEIREAYGDVAKRRPKYLVVPGFWVVDYLKPISGSPQPGEALQKVRRAVRLDVDARNYFGALFAGGLPYRLAHRSVYTAPLGPGLNEYESLTQTVFIFERDPAKDFAPIVTVPKSAANRPAKPLYGELRRSAGDGGHAEQVQGRRGLAFVSLGNHIAQTWGWDA